MDGKGHPTRDNASCAIEGLPESAIADELEKLEANYQASLYDDLITRWSVKLATRPIKYLRAMLASSTWALSKALTNLEATKIQQSNDADRIRWARQIGELSDFIKECWPNEHRLGVQKDTPILTTAKTLLMEYRTGDRK